MTDQEAWRIYFASIAGWKLHPGRTRPGTPQLTISELAAMASQMLLEEKIKWQDGQQSQQRQLQPSGNTQQTRKTAQKEGETEPFKSECQILPYNGEWPI